MTQQITSLTALRNQTAAWRGAGETIALVPTMGALHRGHLALVEAAKRHADRVIVSIFVNPTQFGPNDDFHRYPRPIARDLELLATAGAHAAWTPDVLTMYPEGFATSIHITGITEPMEGAFRPGHFDGVATVVAKLFGQVQPDQAFFGEKDYQQLCLIRQLVRDLDINVSITAVPTLREMDGLALSSRNQYLSEEERRIAPQLAAMLHTVRDAIRGGEPVNVILNHARTHLVKQGFTKVDYIDLRHPETLTELIAYQPTARVLAAAWLGTTRLIDNIEA